MDVSKASQVFGIFEVKTRLADTSHDNFYDTYRIVARDAEEAIAKAKTLIALGGVRGETVFQVKLLATGEMG